MAQIGIGSLGSAYPVALDTLLYNSGGVSGYTNAATVLADSSSRMDCEVLNDVIDAILAIEGELGIAPSDSYATVKARLDAMTALIGAAYTNEMAQDTIGSILVDTATIATVYNDSGPSITFNVVTNSIGPSQLSQSSAVSLLGNPTGSTANVSAITLATGLRFVASTVDLAINSLTADGTPDLANDYVVTWDASASTHKKVLLNLISSNLSGGATDKLAIWSSATTLTNDTELTWNSTRNALSIGTVGLPVTGANFIGLAVSTDLSGTLPADTAFISARNYGVGSTAAGILLTCEDGVIYHFTTQALFNTITPVSNSTYGIVIDQLTATNGLLTFRGTGGVAHGITDLYQTDVFGEIRQPGGNGGVQLRGIANDNVGLVLSDYTSTDPVSTKTTSSVGAMQFNFAKKTGTGVTNMAAGVNLISVSIAASPDVKWLLDSDGDTWQTGSITLDGSITTGGNTPRALTINRHTTADTAGNNFTIETGGATVAATNKIGGNLLLKTGIGTGNSIPSTLQVQTPAFKGGTGTTSQTLVNRWLLNGTANLTSGVATTLITIPLATLEQAGGGIEYSIDVSDGTDLINLAGYVTFSAVNKAGTYTTNASILGTEAIAKSDVVDTLITAFSFNNGANQTQLQITVTATGITATTFRIVYDVFSAAQQNITLG